MVMAATIYDVARTACVTATTVSNVLRDKGSVGARTRARVRQAIEQLDYRPNLIARGLAHQRSTTLAFLLPSIANPFYPEIALEIERIADEQGYRLLLCNTHDDVVRGQAHLDMLVGHRVDGVVAMAGGLLLEDVVAATVRGLPVVLCNWSEVEHEYTLPAVDIDFRRGSRLAARHLLDLGRRDVAVIVQETGEGTRTPSHTQRLDGFVSALREQGAPMPDDAVCYADGDLESGYRAAHVLLSRQPRPTALFATNDMMALGALEAAADAGLSVPDDVAVVGFDDISLGAHVRPTLTTVAIPKRELAAEAMALLLRLIEGDAAPVSATVLPHLVPRRSTARVAPLGNIIVAKGGT